MISICGAGFASLDVVCDDLNDCALFTVCSAVTVEWCACLSCVFVNCLVKQFAICLGVVVIECYGGV